MAAIVVVASVLPASEPSRAQSAPAVRELRAAGPACAAGRAFPVHPAGGSLLWRGCDGAVAARFDYGPNSGRGAAVDQIRAVDPAELPAIAGTTPIAAFELTALSAAPSVTYAAPHPDRSLIASPRIARGSAYELAGYQRDARGVIRIVYQSAVYTAAAPYALAVASPLAGSQLQRSVATTFVLLSLPAPTGPPFTLSSSKGDKLGVTGSNSHIVTLSSPKGHVTLSLPKGHVTLSLPKGEPNVDLYVSDAKNGVSNGTVDEILAGGSSQKVLASGLDAPAGIAVDGAGNVYVAEKVGGLVAELPSAGGPAKSLGTTPVEPTSVAVDGAGNVFVADGSTVQEIPAGGGTPATVASGFSGPTGIALDAAGNLYVADTFHNAVKEVPAGRGTAVTLGSGFSIPMGVAVDGAGNVYVTDAGNKAVKEIEGTSVVTLASGIAGLGQIAVDTAGNAYVTALESGANGVFEIAHGSHVPVAIGSGFTAPAGVAVKPAATPALTLAKTDNGPWRPGINPTPPKYTIAIGNAGTAATMGTITVTDTLPPGLSLSAKPSPLSGTSWACSGAQGSTSFTCTSAVPIPARAGATPSSAVPIVVPVTVGAATKLGPKSITNTAHAFGGGDPLHATSTSALSATDSTTVELEPDVNLYVSDEANGVVDEILAGGGSQATLGSGFSDVRGIAVDGTGNVYLAELGSNTVAEIPAAGGSAITLGTTFNQPTSVAVDGAGDVYVSNFGGGTVQRMPAGGGTPVTVASGFAGPNGITLDSTGNLYVADTFHGKVFRIPAGGGPAVKIGAGFLQPNGVAVDGAGNVYVTDSGHGAIKEVEGASIVTLASGFVSPQQIAVDAAGNVYVADSQRGLFEIPAGSHVPIAVGSGFVAAWGTAVKPAATPALTLRKTDNGPWRPGTNATPPKYTITVGNAGTAATTGTITVTDTLPAGLTLTATPSAQSGTSWTCTGAAGATSFTCTRTMPVSARVGAKPSSAVPIVVPVTIGAATKLGPKSITNTAQAFGGGDPLHATSSSPVSAGDATTVELEPDVNLYLSDGSAGLTADEIFAGGSSQKVLGSGFFGDTVGGIAVDGAGNVYVPSYDGSVGEGNVTEIPAAGGLPIALGTFDFPFDVAVDAAGDVYVADLTGDGGSLQKIPAGGGAPVTLNAGGFLGQSAIALDAADNIYVADTLDHLVFKFNPAGLHGISLGSGFSAPTGIAVDGAGNVYVTDSGLNAVEEIKGTSVVTLASGLTGLGAIAVDTAGNVYFTRVANGANGVFELPAGSSVPVSIGSGFLGAVGVAVKPAATPALTLAKTDNGPWKPGTNATPPKYTIAVGNAGTAATTGTITVTDTLPAGLTLTATPSAQSGTSWTCTGAAGATSFTCTSTTSLAARAGAKPSIAVPIVVPVTVGATTPLGPKSITNTALAYGGGDPAHATSSNTLSASDATTVELQPDFNLYVSDEGAGVIDDIQPGGNSPSTLASGLNDVRGIALSRGNVYVAEVGSNTVAKIPVAGGSPIILGTSFSEPTSVAVDAAGDVFVANFNGGTVQEIVGGTGSPVTFASGFAGPNGIALDSAGNLYVADTFHGRVVRIPKGGGTAVKIGAGFLQPSGVAVDTFGNVYVTDTGHGAVKEVEGLAIVTLATGFSNLQQIAVDTDGNVYVADSQRGVFEIPAGSHVPIPLGSGFAAPWGVAVQVPH